MLSFVCLETTCRGDGEPAGLTTADTGVLVCSMDDIVCTAGALQHDVAGATQDITSTCCAGLNIRTAGADRAGSTREGDTTLLVDETNETVGREEGERRWCVGYMCVVGYGGKSWVGGRCV